MTNADKTLTRMPKTTSNKRKQGDGWSNADHEVRKMEASRKSTKRGEDETMSKRERRSHLLSHDTKNRLEEQKLSLHLTKVTRELKDLRGRLEQWDQESEDRKRNELLKKQQDELAKLTEPPKRRMRLGPETWKLTGAARPAWMVYDFDVRYVDPHAKAHQDFADAVKRQRNLLVLYKKQFGSCDAPSITREFLSLLMQQAMLSLQAKKLKTARAALLECIALESSTAPVTTARCHLIRLYLEHNRPDSARHLIEQYEHDSNCWIRYSAALIEYVSWKLLGEKGSTRASTEATLKQAMQVNPYCALYLAFFSTFQKTMEYTEDVDESADSGLEEAIEYANHEQGAGAWMETEGAIDWLKRVVQRALQTKTLEWSSSLQVLEDLYREQQDSDKEEPQSVANNDAGEEDDGDDHDDEVDVLMYAGMFRTAMEILEENGELTKQVLSEEDSVQNESEEEDGDKEDAESDGNSDSN